MQGFNLRACQVSNRLASAMRVLVLSGLRDRPLILRMTTSGRKLRSARLLSALSQRAARTGTTRPHSAASTWPTPDCAFAWAYWRPNACARPTRALSAGFDSPSHQNAPQMRCEKSTRNKMLHRLDVRRCSRRRSPFVLCSANTPFSALVCKVQDGRWIGNTRSGCPS